MCVREFKAKSKACTVSVAMINSLIRAKAKVRSIRKNKRKILVTQIRSEITHLLKVERKDVQGKELINAESAYPLVLLISCLKLSLRLRTYVHIKYAKLRLESGSEPCEPGWGAGSILSGTFGTL